MRLKVKQKKELDNQSVNGPTDRQRDKQIDKFSLTNVTLQKEAMIAIMKNCRAPQISWTLEIDIPQSLTVIQIPHGYHTVLPFSKLASISVNPPPLLFRQPETQKHKALS